MAPRAGWRRTRPGYIIPVDSDPNEFATDAIAMTDIQNIAESMQAKHVMFVMDACYSGPA